VSFRRIFNSSKTIITSIFVLHLRRLSYLIGTWNVIAILWLWCQSTRIERYSHLLAWIKIRSDSSWMRTCSLEIIVHQCSIWVSMIYHDLLLRLSTTGKLVMTLESSILNHLLIDFIISQKTSNEALLIKMHHRHVPILGLVNICWSI
jgi:hypothetical protein